MKPAKEFTPVYEKKAKHYKPGDTDERLCRGRDSKKWTFTFLVDNFWRTGAPNDKYQISAAILDDQCEIKGVYEWQRCGDGWAWDIKADFLDHNDLSIDENSWNYSPTDAKHWADASYKLMYGNQTWEFEPVERCDLIKDEVFRLPPASIDMLRIEEWSGLLSCPVTFFNK